jgi:type II secretory pathway pseudopilin PulG
MKHPRANRKFKQRGFNLIEAAIVLGVVGLVIGGIWIAAAAVNKNYKINQTQQGVLEIIQRIRQLGHGNAAFTNAESANYLGIMVTNNIGTPAGWQSASGPPLGNSGFSGDKNTSNSFATARYYFYLTVDGVDECIRIGSHFRNLLGRTFEDVLITDFNDDYSTPDQTSICRTGQRPFIINLALN